MWMAAFRKSNHSMSASGHRCSVLGMGPDFAILGSCITDARPDSPDRQTMVTFVS